MKYPQGSKGKRRGKGKSLFGKAGAGIGKTGAAVAKGIAATGTIASPPPGQGSYFPVGTPTGTLPKGSVGAVKKGTTTPTGGTATPTGGSSIADLIAQGKNPFTAGGDPWEIAKAIVDYDIAQQQKTIETQKSQAQARNQAVLNTFLGFQAAMSKIAAGYGPQYDAAMKDLGGSQAAFSQGFNDATSHIANVGQGQAPDSSLIDAARATNPFYQLPGNLAGQGQLIAAAQSKQLNDQLSTFDTQIQALSGHKMEDIYSIYSGLQQQQDAKAAAALSAKQATQESTAKSMKDLRDYAAKQTDLSGYIYDVDANGRGIHLRKVKGEPVAAQGSKGYAARQKDRGIALQEWTVKAAYDLKVRQQGFEEWYKKNYLTVQETNANTAAGNAATNRWKAEQAAKVAKFNAETSRLSSDRTWQAHLDNLGVKLESLRRKATAAEAKRRTGGYTPYQLHGFRKTAATIARNARTGFTDADGVKHPPLTYQQALMEMVTNEDLPIGLATAALNTVYPPGTREGRVKPGTPPTGTRGPTGKGTYQPGPPGTRPAPKPKSRRKKK